MAMSWSYTSEAIENAKENLYNMNREDLEVCYAECRMYYENRSKDRMFQDDFDLEVYGKILKSARNKTHDYLFEFVWEVIETDIRGCTNDFKEIMVCPYGCHYVSIDKKEK